jgi:hypothetical protein
VAIIKRSFSKQMSSETRIHNLTSQALILNESDTEKLEVVQNMFLWLLLGITRLTSTTKCKQQKNLNVSDATN